MVVESANHSKMEDSFNGTLQDTQKVETSLIEDKQMVVDDATAADADATSKETYGVDIAMTGKQTEQSEENKTEDDASESVAETFEPIEPSPTDSSDAIKYDTVELELKEDEGKDFQSPEDADGVKETELLPSDDNNELSAVSGNEEVVETIKDMMIAEEEKNVLSSVVTDEGSNKNYGSSSLPPTEASKETLETSVPEPDESDKAPPIFTGEEPKAIEETLVPSTYEKVGEQSHFQEPSSYESARETFQPSPNVPLAESTSPVEQDKTEEPRSTENPVSISHFMIISCISLNLCLVPARCR